MSATPTKLDHTLARKKTEKAAAEAPLLALLGLTPVYTAQGQADQRERCRAGADEHEAQQAAEWARETEAARVETLGLVGPVEFLQHEQRLAASPFLSSMALSSRWSWWIYIRNRARRGETINELMPEVLAKPRARVDPQAVYQVLAASPIPLHSTAIADALGGATILDVAEAERSLRDAGRIVTVVRREKFVGFTTPERANP